MSRRFARRAIGFWAEGNGVCRGNATNNREMGDRSGKNSARRGINGFQHDVARILRNPYQFRKAPQQPVLQPDGLTIATVRCGAIPVFISPPRYCAADLLPVGEPLMCSPGGSGRAAIE